MSNLKLIMAVSADGFVSNGPDDHMDWTGPDDKRAFRLLTSVGGVLGAGRRTFELLPVLKGRRVVCISTRRGYVQNAKAREVLYKGPSAQPVPSDACMEQTVSLGHFAHRFPDAWLIGGQTVALEALRVGLVSQAYICRVPIELYCSSLFNPYDAQEDRISPFLRSRDWTRPDRVRLGDTSVEVWRRP